MKNEINDLILKYGRENVSKYIDEIMYAETYKIAYDDIKNYFSEMKDVLITEYNVIVFIPVCDSIIERAKNLSKTPEDYNKILNFDLNWILYDENYCQYSYIKLDCNQLYVDNFDNTLDDLKYKHDLKNYQIKEIFKNVMMELYNLKDVEIKL